MGSHTTENTEVRKDDPISQGQDAQVLERKGNILAVSIRYGEKTKIRLDKQKKRRKII